MVRPEQISQIGWAWSERLLDLKSARPCAELHSDLSLRATTLRFASSCLQSLAELEACFSRGMHVPWLGLLISDCSECAFFISALFPCR